MEEGVLAVVKGEVMVGEETEAAMEMEAKEEERVDLRIARRHSNAQNASNSKTCRSNFSSRLPAQRHTAAASCASRFHAGMLPRPRRTRRQSRIPSVQQQVAQRGCTGELHGHYKPSVPHPKSDVAGIPCDSQTSGSFALEVHLLSSLDHPEGGISIRARP